MRFHKTSDEIFARKKLATTPFLSKEARRLRFTALLFSAFVSLYGAWAMTTMYWVLSGHCCGAPLISEWGACVPAGEKMWFTFLKTGHCDQVTWRRVP
jgi:hypothetical protein